MAQNYGHGQVVRHQPPCLIAVGRSLLIPPTKIALKRGYLILMLAATVPRVEKCAHSAQRYRLIPTTLTSISTSPCAIRILKISATGYKLAYEIAGRSVSVCAFA